MDEETISNAGDGESARPKAVQFQPNGTACRAKSAGFGDYVDCLVASHLACEYALNFANGRLCLHDARWKIVARTGPVDSEPEELQT